MNVAGAQKELSETDQNQQYKIKNVNQVTLFLEAICIELNNSAIRHT